MDSYWRWWTRGGVVLLTCAWMEIVLRGSAGEAPLPSMILPALLTIWAFGGSVLGAFLTERKAKKAALVALPGDKEK